MDCSRGRERKIGRDVLVEKYFGLTRQKRKEGRMKRMKDDEGRMVEREDEVFGNSGKIQGRTWKEKRMLQQRYVQGIQLGRSGGGNEVLHDQKGSRS